MGLRIRTGVITMASLALFGQWALADISAVTRTGTTTNCAPSIAPAKLDEGALTFCDRTHIYADVPAQVKGAQYLMVSNSDRNVPDLVLDLTVGSDGVLLLLIDNRVGDGDNTNPPTLGAGKMDWVLADGFVDTGMDIGIDESANGSIDQHFSIYQKPVTAGAVQIFEQNDGTSRNNYTVAFVAQELNQVPSVGTIGLMALAILLLGAGVLALRRRPALAS